MHKETELSDIPVLAVLLGLWDGDGVEIGMVLSSMSAPSTISVVIFTRLCS